MRNPIFVLLILWGFFGSTKPARAVSEAQILEQGVDYTFGGRVVFWVKWEEDLQVREAQVFFKSKGETKTQMGQAVVIRGEAYYEHDLTQQPLRAFSETSYWFGLIFENNQTYTSPVYSFFYEDNRFTWNTKEDKPFHVHWYEGDLAFGQSVLDAAQAGMQKAESLFLLSAPERIDIYVYASISDMHSTIRLAGLELVAGHASPDLGVMVVSLPRGPDQRIETERQIPHELMHVLLYHSYPQNYTNLPAWFNEGLATLTELYPNPDYYVILKDAFEKDSLAPIGSLCRQFPLDAAGFYLAYAESASFTRYLYQQYGGRGILSLLEAYANGLSCERGVEVALGVPLAKLEVEWRQETFWGNAYRKALDTLAPWLVIFILVMVVPLALSVQSILRKVNQRAGSQVDKGATLPGG